MEKKIHKSSIVDKIIYAIIDMIDQRVLSPGDKLDSEREFAQKLNVSRTSVREALKSLSFVQLVEIRPSDGTYLTDDINLINEFCTKYNPLVVLNGIDYQKAYESRKILSPQSRSWPPTVPRKKIFCYCGNPSIFSSSFSIRRIRGNIRLKTCGFTA